MRWKRLISSVSIVAFSLSMFAATPSFADAEADRQQVRAFIAVVGAVAIVGTIFMLSEMNKDFSQQDNSDNPNKLPLNMDVGLNFISQEVSRGSIDNLTPILQIRIPF